MHSLTQKYLKQLVFSAEGLTILRTIGEYQGKQALYFKQSPEILKGLQQVAMIESSESSNRLEGITAPHQRIADLVVKNTGCIPGAIQRLKWVNHLRDMRCLQKGSHQLAPDRFSVHL